MTVNQRIEKIENGSDILFDVISRHFVVFTWTDGEIGIDEQYPHDHGLPYFQARKHWFTDTWPLSDIAEKIVITDYT